jgi:hypothetical protein
LSDRTTTPILATIVAVAIAAAGCGGKAAAAPVSTEPALDHTASGVVAMPAKKIVSTALRAARREGSVRVRIVSGYGGGYVQTDDSGPTVGSQEIRASSLHATVRVVGTTAYVRSTTPAAKISSGSPTWHRRCTCTDGSPTVPVTRTMCP